MYILGLNVEILIGVSTMYADCSNQCVFFSCTFNFEGKVGEKDGEVVLSISNVERVPIYKTSRFLSSFF